MELSYEKNGNDGELHTVFPLKYCRAMQRVAAYSEFWALNASAYVRICFTMASNPLERVGERCCERPMSSMK